MATTDNLINFFRNIFIRYTPSVKYRMSKIWDYDAHNEVRKHL